MTFRELELLVRKLSYKPKSRFELLQPGFDKSDELNRQLQGNAIILIHQEVQDAKSPRNTTTVTYVGKIPLIELEYLSAQAVLGKFWYWLEQMEVHEMKEWFQYDGEHFKEPHPGLKKLKEAQHKAAQAHATLSAGRRAEFVVLDELEESDGSRGRAHWGR